MKRYFTLKDQEGQVRGELHLEDDSSIDVLNTAITPIAEIDKDAAPRIAGFLISPRTELDVRRREAEYPHRHLGHIITHGNLPDHDETTELSEKGMLDD